jgi:HSP20 family protein
MSLELIPRSFWSTPSRLQSIFDEDDTWTNFLPSSGLTISEDETHVYVEAALPGLEKNAIDVTYDKGVLWIRGSQNSEENDKNKKFYRKASQSYSYRISVPGNIDDTQETDTVYKNGVIRVTFKKVPENQPKKLNIRDE